MSKIRINTRFDLKDLAVAIAEQQADLEVLIFIEDLDAAMASWDFTAKAAELFVRTCMSETHDDLRGQPVESEAVARVAEFLRQAQAQPHVQHDQPITTTWTDPQAELAPLIAADLALLIRLATVALALPPVESGE